MESEPRSRTARRSPDGRRALLAFLIALTFVATAPAAGAVAAKAGVGQGEWTVAGGPGLKSVRAPTWTPQAGEDATVLNGGAGAVHRDARPVSPTLEARALAGLPGRTTGVPGVYDLVLAVDEPVPPSAPEGAAEKLAARLSAQGYDVVSVLPLLGMVELSGVGGDDLGRLAATPGVARVDERGIPVMFSDIATPSAKARESELFSPDTAWELGYSGEGISLCVMDTGIDDSHPTHAGKFLGGADISKPETFFTPRDGTFNPDDTQGHGTTCAGIASGTGAPDGTYMGTAPAAHLVDLRIGTIIGYAPGEIAQSFYDASLQGEEWALDNKDATWPNGGEEYRGIDVLSLSWGIDVGYSSDGQDPYSVGLDRLMDAGVVAVVAAGNDGPDNDGFTGMGASSKCITIGATDDLNTLERGDDIIAEYSSRGPRADNGDSYPYDELKPDISAMGTNINNCNFDRTGDGSGQDYGPRGSGTSYATPLVAGVVCLMLEANPNLDPFVVKEILRVTSERRGGPSAPELDPFWNRDFGWGMVDAYEAVKMAVEVTDPNSVDVELQCFITHVDDEGSVPTMHGISWARAGEVGKVQVSVDGGGWHSAKKGGDGTWTNWTLKLDPFRYGKGNHTFQARAVSPDGMTYSLHDTAWFILEEKGAGGLAAEGDLLMWIAGCLAVIAVCAAYLKFRPKKGSKD